MSTEQGDVVLRKNGSVADVILDRSHKRNALTPYMLAKLGDQLRVIAVDEALRVVRIRGAGDVSFCAGADLNAFRGLNPSEIWRGWTTLGQGVFAALTQLPQTTIAVLSGDALGGGLELAAHCDLRVASDTVRVGLPEATLGTLPGWAGLSKMSELIGTSRTRLLAMTGRLITAIQAAEWGLVDVVAPPDAFGQAQDGLVEQLLRTGPSAQRILKARFANGTDLSMLVDSLGGAVAAWEGESAEGVAAMLERRTASWNVSTTER